ncbi:hypothetical protein CFC21_041973, partial [Triticum aestivum]
CHLWLLLPNKTTPPTAMREGSQPATLARTRLSRSYVGGEATHKVATQSFQGLPRHARRRSGRRPPQKPNPRSNTNVRAPVERPSFPHTCVTRSRHTLNRASTDSYRVAES